MSPPISQAFVTKPKPVDVCQVRCVNTELVAQVSEALPGDDVLEEAQILWGSSRQISTKDPARAE